jgi:glutathione S-transferase
MPLKLTYFNIYGRSEPIRMMLTKAGAEWEDERLEFAEWPAIKPTKPHGCLPVITLDDGYEISMGLPCFNYVANTYGFQPTNPLDQYRGQMLYECIMNDMVLIKLLPTIQKNLKDPESEEVKELAESVWAPACVHLVRELPKDKKFIAGDKMTVHDYTIGCNLLGCFRNPNAAHKDMWNAWEKASMPPRVVTYINDLEAELKEYLDTRNAEKPSPF